MNQETADRILDAVLEVFQESSVSIMEGMTLLAKIQSIIYSEVT